MSKSVYTTQNDLLLKNLMDFYKTDNDDGTFNSNNNLANDAKKATELSKESLDSSDSKINKTN